MPGRCYDFATALAVKFNSGTVNKRMSGFNNPYQAPQNVQGSLSGWTNEPQRQSTWGKVSFIIALVTIGFDTLFIGFSVIADETGMGDGPGEGIAALMGFGCCGSFVANMVGVVFGIVGLVERDKLRGLAIAGLLLNLLPLLLIFGAMIVGMFALNQAMQQFGN